ncbi:carbohydrate ABC transporter permease [Cohnella sp. REN36]|uniref:carbohydrate ABC transporter permease n=1 Tax=Cohnella sp. REN36 TaxID=2887347 RepID=UPI001D15710D|nr:sugar ABC transporter permease [Cohnella sp. REN36]MCC3372126.1 sugar ABC transporter permease [Cohnella sp. REN36]
MNKRKEMVAGYAMIAPAILLYLMVGLVTLLFSIWIAFQHVNAGSLISSAKFAGFDNFKDFLWGGDSVATGMFFSAIKNNLIIAASLIVIVIPLSLVLAVLLQNIRWFAKGFRTIFLIPMVTASVAIFYVWQGIYDPAGALNTTLSAFGLDALVAKNGWLGEINTALPAIIAQTCWGAIPATLILYVAGLQSVDTHLYESADIDGATALQKLLHITWPVLRPITAIAVIMTINGAMQIFDNIWLMTKGGPAGSTQVVNVLVYQDAFASGKLSRANAMGWTVFLVTFLFSLISLKALRSKT